MEGSVAGAYIAFVASFVLAVDVIVQITSSAEAHATACAFALEKRLGFVAIIVDRNNIVG
tara:strand:+ start:173 stop:352 length:180 start_codon:yes stop_codon:yes gene_type:complete